jgi:hypothetical protein
MGWNITPSHFIGQDLADVWIAGDTATMSAHDHVSR